MLAAFVLPLFVIAGGPAKAAPAGGANALSVDGKKIPVTHVTVIQRPDVFTETKEAYTLAFTGSPIPLAGIGSEDAFSAAMKQGVLLMLGQDNYCKLVIRDPSLGADMQMMGGGICSSDSVKVFGPDRVQGHIASGPAGRESLGHKLIYDLSFDAPVGKRFFPRK